MSDNNINQKTQYVIEVVIRLGFLLLLVAWCLQILFPFAGILIWALILALAVEPLYLKLNRVLGNKPKLASTILIIVGLTIIILPSWLFLDSLIAGLSRISTELEAGTIKIPPPTQEVADWPLIGEKAYELWTQASENIEDFIAQYNEQIHDAASGLLINIGGIGKSIIQLILATIIAGILLATKGTADLSRKFFHKLVGSAADEFTAIISVTVQNVVKGVIGVAFIQAFLIGLGLLFAGVPYAGLWALLVFVLAILQLPVLLVIIGIILWMFSVMSTLPAVLWTIYLVAAGASDNVLKPILLGKGAAVPMIVIFIGVIGGFMLSGFIGLFTGAIILSLGYKLFMVWLNKQDA